MLIHLLPMLQSSSSDISAGDAAAGAAGLLIGLIFVVFYLAFIALILASWWKIHAKAGKPGWTGIVPVYNLIVLMEIIGRPAWWVALLVFPCTGIVFVFIVAIDLAKSFGKDAGYGIGLALLGPIFLPMLGFGSATYRGPSAPPAA